MNKFLNLFGIICIAGSLSAKKVKFAVDMTGHTISPSGVHITGDFQAIAGLGADWDPGTAPLAQVGTSNIYSIIVNIPAFRKYEYKIVNGNLSYETEIVPEESRVDLFADNRWLFVDSLANDTTFAGALMFGGNAPAGLFLLRYKVNMLLETVPATGVHVGRSTFSFDPAKIRMYTFSDNVYDIINYVASGTYGYKFFNGNTAGNSETVPSACTVSGARSITVAKDTVLPVICFSSCAQCIGVGIKQNSASALNIKIYPNPATDLITIQSDLTGNYALTVSDYTGKALIVMTDVNDTEKNVDVSDLNTGIYFIRIRNAQGQTQTSKLIID